MYKGNHILRARRQPGPTKLLILPLEVLIEVMRLLDWRDVLQLRQTCKYLSEATRAKSTWFDLFHASNAAHSWSPLLLERPIEFYTAQELEYLVVRRESEEVKRQTRDQLFPALTRRLPIDISDKVGALTLINGGRWLLTASYHDSVSYYDLDAQNPVERPLIPKRRLRNYPFRGVKMDVHIDDESAVLSFNLAIYLHRIRNVGNRLSGTHNVQVWRVTLQLDDQNHGTSLSATLLSSFPREICGTMRAISLRGRYIAFAVQGPRNDPAIPHYISIVDWAEANSQSWSRRQAASKLSYPRKVISTYSPPVCVQLLPENKICLAQRYHRSSCHDISTFQLTASFPPITFATPWNSSYWPHCTKASAPTESLSQPYYCKNTNILRFVANNGYSIQGVILPCPSEVKGKIEVIPLINFKFSHEKRSLFLGHNSAILTGGTPPVQMLSYSWPDGAYPDPLTAGPSNSSVVKLGKKNWKSVNHFAYDEVSGRIVAESRDGIVIYDLAKFKNCI